MTKYLVIINSLCYNRGSEALVEGFSSIIKKNDNDSHIIVATSDIDVSTISLKNVDEIVSKYDYKNKKSLKRLFSKIVKKITKSENFEINFCCKKLKKYSKECDFVIVVGADNYDATYGMSKKMHYMNMFLRKNTDSKMVLYDCSIEKSHLTYDVLDDMNMFDYIIAREKITYEVLKSSNICKPIYYFPDPAFVLETSKVDLDYLNSNDFVGVNLSELVLNMSEGMIFNNYKKLIDYILNDLKMKVLLIPHVMNGADLNALKILKSEFVSNDVILIDNEKYNCMELKYIISKCKYIVTARTHISIASYSLCIPTLVLGYSIKSKGIAFDLFDGFDGYVCSYTDLIDEKTLVEKFKWIVDNHTIIKKNLEIKMKSYKNEVFNLYNLFVEKKINIKYDKCTNCKACLNVCPKNCIIFEMDNKGFYYPKIDATKCINCGQCLNVCQANCLPLNNNDLNEIKCFAAYNNSRDELLKSSSGGLFILFAKKVIEQNGVVYGAIVRDKYKVVHKRVERINELELLQGSKYVQSDIGFSYKLCEKDLIDGKIVLFSGTPCQIGGLYKFLKKRYLNLYTVAVVCHGVPSEYLFNKYIIDKQREHNSDLVSYVWRDKTNGWAPNKIKMIFENGDIELTQSRDNAFQKGFLKNVYLRPSCYKCEYSKLPRIEDISLADFWGYDGRLNNENGGLSMISYSNSHGKELFESIVNDITFHEVDLNYVKERSQHFWSRPSENYDRFKCYKKMSLYSFTKINKKWINKNVFKKTIDKIFK